MISRTDKKRPVVTVITPSFNQGKYIKRTIDSVLSQGIPNIEHLVFDAGSNDETISILRAYGDLIQWVSEPDRGQADAVNKGLKATKGEIIGWLNSDDVYYPGAFKAVLEAFDLHPEVDIIYGMADHLDEEDNVIEPYHSEEWDYGKLRDVCFICQPAVFFRKQIVEDYGVLDENLRYCMDYEYWLRIGRVSPFYYLKQKLAGSRLYRENKTLGSAVAVHEEILQMFKRKYPPVPDRWIFNHAHVVARELGLRDGSSEFVRKIIFVSLQDSLKLRYFIPRSVIKVLIDWIKPPLRVHI